MILAKLFAGSVLGLASLLAAESSAQSAKLFVDLRPNGGSNPNNIISVFGQLYFAADDGKHGYELWTSDGTKSGTRLVKDILPGSSASTPQHLTRFGTKVVFSAATSSSINRNFELWISDGTAAGTKLIKDIWPGSKSSFPQSFLAWKGKLYFSANDGLKGWELWESDGTTAGTKLVKDIWPGPSGSGPAFLVNAGDHFQFAAIESVKRGRELWRSDGSAAGTRMVREIETNGTSYPYGLRYFRGKVYFAARTWRQGFELYSSDGSYAGTKLVRDIAPGSSSSVIDGLAVFGGQLLFQADPPGKGRELYSTDGSSAGTRLLADVWPGAKPSQPGLITALGARKAWFAAWSSNGLGRELFVTDGTTAGTRFFQDIMKGTASSMPYNYGNNGIREMAYAKGKLYFTADNGVNGRELFVLDPAAAVAQPFGATCGGLQLEASDPVLGLKDGVKLKAFALRPRHVGLYVLGSPPSLSLVAPPCELYFDLLKPWFVVHAFGTGNSTKHQIALTMPAHPAFSGMRLAVQVLGLDPGPKGPSWRASNGIELVLHAK